MKLSRKRLLALSDVADKGGLWVNTSWSDWPSGEQPRWALEQFSVAKELVRLALLGLEAERKNPTAERNMA